jgi:hypothetical protein
MQEVETLFLIAIGTDGSLTSFGEVPEDMPKPNRLANNLDVYQASKQIVDDWESGMLVDRITRSVLAAINPPAPQSVPEKLKEALKDRNINPESVSLNE